MLCELEIVAPRLVIGLGRYAEDALRSTYPEARVLSWPFAVPKGTGPRSPDLLLAQHPSWVMKQPKDFREQYVTSLALVLKWGFRDRPSGWPSHRDGEALTFAQTAQRLGVGVLTVRAWARTDLCPVVRDGRRVRIAAWWVAELIGRAWTAP